MTEKSVAQKAHIKPGTTIAALNPAPGIVEALGLPEDVTFVEPGSARSKRCALGLLPPGLEGRRARHEPRQRLGDRREVGYAAFGSRGRQRHVVGVPAATCAVVAATEGVTVPGRSHEQSLR